MTKRIHSDSIWFKSCMRQMSFDWHDNCLTSPHTEHWLSWMLCEVKWSFSAQCMFVQAMWHAVLNSRNVKWRCSLSWSLCPHLHFSLKKWMMLSIKFTVDSFAWLLKMMFPLSQWRQCIVWSHCMPCVARWSTQSDFHAVTNVMPNTA